MSRYVAFDVETPNYANDRMSAIGVVVLEDGEIIRRFGTLINPETHFDWFNVQLTGITQEAAAKSPTFPEIWTLIEPWFSSGVLAAASSGNACAIIRSTGSRRRNTSVPAGLARRSARACRITAWTRWRRISGSRSTTTVL